MPRYCAKIRYTGTDFHGFQMQPQKTSVQDVLQKSLYQILREEFSLCPSGRTDAGVHALAQYVHFDLKLDVAIDRIQSSDFLYRINSILPPSINILEVQPVPSTFHARRSAIKKTYAYWILKTPFHNPFFTDRAWQMATTLNIVDMEHASQHLIGTHDFSGFCASDSIAKTKTRTLHSIQFLKHNASPFFSVAPDEWLCIEFTGNGFLKQMVRNIVGTLYEIGRGRWSKDHTLTVLQSQDRSQAGFTAPACGLYLKNVEYDVSLCTP